MDQREAAFSAIRQFLLFVETRDRDAQGHHCFVWTPESTDGETLERLWSRVCMAIGALRREIMERAPIVNGFRERRLLSVEDAAMSGTLSNALFASALTRYTPEGHEWVAAMARSVETPPVGKWIVEADRVRKLRLLHDMLKPESREVDDSAKGARGSGRRGNKTTRQVFIEPISGVELSDYQARLALSRTAYLVCSGDYKAALRWLDEQGRRIGRGTYFTHLKVWDERTPGWKDGARHSDSGASGKSEFIDGMSQRRKRRGN